MFCLRWLFCTPAILLAVLIMTFINYSPAFSTAYAQENYVFPPAIQAIGWLMAFAAPALILGGAVLQRWRQDKNATTDWISMTWLRKKIGFTNPDSKRARRMAGIENLSYKCTEL